MLAAMSSNANNDQTFTFTDMLSQGTIKSNYYPCFVFIKAEF